MLNKLQKVLIDECKLDVNKPILVGLSGGPDSLALVDVLHQLGYQVIIGHLNHMLRSESSEEALQVENFANIMGFPFVQSIVDVSEYAIKHGLSIEEAARNLRYDFLFYTALQFDVQAIAVGHSADDQVETVLMHLLRGAGLAGLRGMAYRSLPNAWSDRIPLIRPLLAVWRDEILHYCQLRELTPVIDKSNLDQTYFRNRLRHDLIPYLETYNPKMKDTILRTANILGEDYRIITEVIEKAWEDCIIVQGTDYVALDVDNLLEQRLGVLRHLIRKAIAYQCPDLRDIDYQNVESAISFISKPTKTFQRDFVSGLRLLIEANILWIAKWGANLPEIGWPVVPGGSVITLHSPDTLALGNGWELSAGILPATDSIKTKVMSNHDPYQAWLDASNLAPNLQVRPRIPGDRFQPLGMEARNIKLSDFLINEKMPRRARETWPLVCFGETILWVPGYRSHHAYRLTEKTEKVLYLQLKSRRKPLLKTKEVHNEEDFLTE